MMLSPRQIRQAERALDRGSDIASIATDLGVPFGVALLGLFGGNPDHTEQYAENAYAEPQPETAVQAPTEEGPPFAVNGHFTSLPGAEGAVDPEPIIEPQSSPSTANEVPAQDGSGNETCNGSEPLGKSNAARPASVDADVNDGTPAGETGNEVVTAGETATSLPAADKSAGALAPAAPVFVLRYRLVNELGQYLHKSGKGMTPALTLAWSGDARQLEESLKRHPHLKELDPVEFRAPA